MTTTTAEDVALGSALAVLWQRHRQTNLDRISTLESITANVLRSSADERAIADGLKAAHQLAGSLGTFGFDAGSRAALEAEFLLREPEIDGRLLAEAVTALRASVEEVGEATPDPIDRSAGDPAGAAPVVTVQVASVDPDLVSRLTAEAAIHGIAVSSAGVPPTGDHEAVGSPPVLIIDGSPLSPWSRTELLRAVSFHSVNAPVIVLSAGDGFEERAELAGAGATAVLPRSLGARQVISRLAEAETRRSGGNAVVLGMNIDPALLGRLSGPGSPAVDGVEVRNDPPEFWEVLEEKGADLVVVGFDGPVLGGPDLCRLIRGHPRWNRLPVVVVDGPGPSRATAAFDAGADDYVPADASPDDLSARVRHQLEGGRLARARGDTDPLTGTENRAGVERSLDLLLQASTHRDEPLTIALLAVDELERVRQTEGNAMADIVVRRLGVRLQEAFPGEDLVGRWTDNGFAVAVYGADCEHAQQRMAAVLTAFGAEEFASTSGAVARFTFSAGMASYPTDGSTLNSLERTSETALRRAGSARNSIVTGGERPDSSATATVDVALVEDDDSVADVIEHALNLRRYSFVRFDDGAEAATALGEGRVRANVVLLDIGLPSLDGFGVLHVLRDQGVLDHTRVIMLTARSSETEMLRAQGLGAHDHITKPFSMPVLLGRLEQIRPQDAS
jgi:diguanylate cyclase (GGDEF)-like protein